MRLLEVNSQQLEEFNSEPFPTYAILSHTWERDEVTFQDMAFPSKAQQKAGYRKIRYVCDQAVRDGLCYAWIDTCCIDKTSSAELSESINSMWQWYKHAAVCYAYLADVPGAYIRPRWDDETHRWDSVSRGQLKAFQQSRWFRRGWTLQELIAPREVKFYGRGWKLIGTRDDHLAEGISKRTRIPTDVLLDPSLLQNIVIAKKMSWAADRETTRLEDEAYCLMGLFNVNMPMLYGEGSKAFLRLQEEIIKTSTDQSIFAWNLRPLPSTDSSQAGMFALRPGVFKDCENVVAANMFFWTTIMDSAFETNNMGLSITLGLLTNPSDQRRDEDGEWNDKHVLGLLNCVLFDFTKGRHFLAVKLKRVDGELNTYTALGLPERICILDDLSEENVSFQRIIITRHSDVANHYGRARSVRTAVSVFSGS